MFESCTVRAVTHEDLAMILAWRNHPDVRRFMFSQHEIDLDEHRSWYAKVSLDPSFHLLIVEDAHRPIGCVQFKNVVQGGVADWGFYARPDSPKGSGRKLGIAALNYAFSTLNLHKICGQVIENNQASISFHKRFGFTQEGVLRDQKRIGNIYLAVICFGLLAHEWQAENLLQEKKDA